MSAYLAIRSCYRDQTKTPSGDAIAVAKEARVMLNPGSKIYNSDKLIHGGL